MSTEGNRRDPEALLDRHRRDIEALDRRILHLVCERLELAGEIGRLKSEQGVPLRNFKVETEVYGRFEEASRFLGLDPVVGHDLARFLIEKAVEEQASRRDTVYRGDALACVVVGGKGGMGRWIGRFLRGQGHRVGVVDPAPGPCEHHELATLEEAAAADLVMVAVPMSACARVVGGLAGAGARGVVAELCSLKGHLEPAARRWRQNGLRLVGFHPLFGPDVRMLAGRTIVFCTEARRDDLDLVRGLFADTSARLVEMSAAEHDRRMGLVLGLTHLANLVFARALALSGTSSAELAEVAAVTFTKQLATTTEVIAENPELYYEIQALNDATVATGDWLRQALDEWLVAVGRGGAPAFASLMGECRAALEPAGASAP